MRNYHYITPDLFSPDRQFRGLREAEMKLVWQELNRLSREESP